MAGEITTVRSLPEVCPHTGLAAHDNATAMHVATARRRRPPVEQMHRRVATQHHPICPLKTHLLSWRSYGLPRCAAAAPFPGVASVVRKSMLIDVAVRRSTAEQLAGCNGHSSPTRK